jgi:putative endonuclease
MAPSRRSLGELGERLAVQHLEAKGYRIVRRGYRTREGEVDIIAERGGVLVFVEVRCRRGNRMGAAVESLTAAKKRRMVALAEGYEAGEMASADRRIDVIALDFDERGKLLSLRHLEGAVWAE